MIHVNARNRDSMADVREVDEWKERASRMDDNRVNNCSDDSMDVGSISSSSSCLLPSLSWVEMFARHSWQS